MSKTTIKGVKGRKEIYHAIYDFSSDGGSFGAGNEIDLFDLKSGTIIHDGWFEVETAVVGDSSTLEVGVTGGDTDGIFSQIAEATLVADYVSDEQAKGDVLYDDSNDHGIRYKVTADTTISMLIGTAALTAGKVHFYLECSDGY
jgi:hypothetical protein